MAAGNESFAAGITTWTGTAGGGNGSWSTASNWSTIPTTSGTWGLVFGGITQTTSTNTIGTLTVNALSFTNSGTTGQTAVFTLSGSTLALTSASVTTTATNGAAALSNAGDTIANALSLTGTNTFTIGVGHNLAVTGTISGAGALQVNASNESGWVYMNATNSYSGGTVVNSGVVQNGSRGSTTDFNSSAFGSGGIVVSGSGTVQVRNGSTLTNNFTIGGPGAKGNGVDLGAIRGSFGTNSQTATLSGTVTLASDAKITTGASASVTGSKLLLSGPVNLGANVLTLAPALASGGASSTVAVPIEISGVISGSGSVVVAADPLASVLLSGSNSYSGGTTLTSGTLRAGSGTALGTGSVTLTAGSLDLNGQSLVIGSLSGTSGAVVTTSVAGPASLETRVTAGKSTYGGSIVDGAGVVSLVKSGTGWLYLTGSSNSYSGGTTVSNGLVQNGASNSLTDFQSNAFGTGAIIVSGSGTVQVRNASSMSNNFTIGGAGTNANGVDLGAIRGSFGTNNQTATLSGTVTLASDARITTGASANVTGSKLLLSGPIQLGSNVLTLAPGLASSGTSAASAVPIEVSGRISGSGSVVIAGDPFSSVLLSGSSNYSGGTTVNAGTLRVGNAHAVGTGALQVNNGGILDLNGHSLSVGSLQLNNGATTLMGISGTSAGLYDQVVAATSVAFGGTLAINFTQAGFAVDDVWQLFSGNLGGHFSGISATGAYGNLTFNYTGNGEWKATGGLLADGQSLSFYETDVHAFHGLFKAGQLVLVPEPSAVAMAGIGVFLAGCRYWRRRRLA